MQGGQARVTALLKAKEQELHRVGIIGRLEYFQGAHLILLPPVQLAHALVEHETLDSDEVRKVIKGEPIRNIVEILAEDLAQAS